MREPLYANNLALLRIFAKARPEGITEVSELSKRRADWRGSILHVPEAVQNAAKDYVEKRAYFSLRGYFSERRFQRGDNPNALFAVAAYFLDWQILRIFKHQWRAQLRSWRDQDGKNLLMGALEMQDRNALFWFLEENICDIKDVDVNGSDALKLALHLGNRLLINDILRGGAPVTLEHLICATAFSDYEIVAELALLYRYSECPYEYQPAGLNFFRYCLFPR